MVTDDLHVATGDLRAAKPSGRSSTSCQPVTAFTASPGRALFPRLPLCAPLSALCWLLLTCFTSQGWRAAGPSLTSRSSARAPWGSGWSYGFNTICAWRCPALCTSNLDIPPELQMHLSSCPLDISTDRHPKISPAKLSSSYSVPSPRACPSLITASASLSKP